jgi:hypothetical protein
MEPPAPLPPTFPPFIDRPTDLFDRPPVFLCAPQSVCVKIRAILLLLFFLLFFRQQAARPQRRPARATVSPAPQRRFFYGRSRSLSARNPAFPPHTLSLPRARAHAHTTRSATEASTPSRLNRRAPLFARARPQKPPPVTRPASRLRGTPPRRERSLAARESEIERDARKEKTREGDLSFLFFFLRATIAHTPTPTPAPP